MATVLAFCVSAIADPTPDEVGVGVEPVAQVEASKYPKIPGYNQAQSNNIWAIVGQIKKEKFGKNDLVACKATFATAITESKIYNYANDKVPKSLKYAHDKNKEDSDLDSVGVFQQRGKYFPLDQAMIPAKAAHIFFKGMKGVKDWEETKTAKQVGALCQKVQRTSSLHDQLLAITLTVHLTQVPANPGVTRRTWTRPSRFARRPRLLEDDVDWQISI